MFWFPNHWYNESHINIYANELQKCFEFRFLLCTKALGLEILSIFFVLNTFEKIFYWTPLELNVFRWSNCTFNFAYVDVMIQMGCYMM